VHQELSISKGEYLFHFPFTSNFAVIEIVLFFIFYFFRAVIVEVFFKNYSYERRWELHEKVPKDRGKLGVC